MYVHGPTAGNGIGSARAVWPDLPEGQLLNRGVPSRWSRALRDLVVQLQTEARQDYQVDATSSIVRLLSLQAQAVECKDMKAAIRAEELIGRVAGLYVERRHTVTQDLTREESESRLAMLAERYPKLLDVILNRSTIDTGGGMKLVSCSDERLQVDSEAEHP